ncbi:MAG: GGDEF domain-containing protein [Pseudomonadota bacterium]
MKVGGPKKPAPPSRAVKSKSANPAEQAKAVPPTDPVSIAGIPENELTPRVREALFALMEEVRALRAELVEARQEMSALKTLADEDPLLGVLNRRAFVKELNRMLAMVERYNARASLVFIDVNDLKEINDREGHAAGDAALKHVAQTLVDNIRQTDILGRLGGDEFGLILLESSADEAKAKATSLQSLVAHEEVKIGETLRRIAIACGVASLSADVTAEDALGAADKAMYQEKRGAKAPS